MVDSTRMAVGALTATALLASVLVGATVRAQGGVNEAARTHEFPWGTFALAPRIVEEAAAGTPLNIVVSTIGTRIPVFGPEQSIGVARGCKENADHGLAIVCRLVGPEFTDTTGQLAELQTLLAGDAVDCLGVSSPAPDSFVDIANQYVDAGIPVFTEHVDIPGSKRFAFYSINERAAAETNGRTTAELVRTGGLPIVGIGMGSGGPSEPWARDQMGGFEAGYREIIPDADFRMDEASGLPTGDGYTEDEVVASVGSYLAAHADVNLFFHTDQGAAGVGKAIHDGNLVGKAWASGFDLNVQMLDLMDQGIILVTTGRGFDNQAQAVVRGCVDYLLGGSVPDGQKADVEPAVITKEGGEGRQSSADARRQLQRVLAGS